jgi:type I restriction enzyme S subunit
MVLLMLNRTLVGKSESTVISELRDTLLPKLISGELRIPDAEKFLEEAGI